MLAYRPICRPGVNFANLLAQSANAPALLNKIHQFYQQNCAKLYNYTQLGVMTNFYTVRSTLCAGKIKVNLLVQKLLIK